MLMASRRFLLLLALLPAAVGAQPTAHTGWYAGGSIGYGRVYFNDTSLRFAGPTNVSKDENDAVYRLFAGYRAHRNFALEAGWVDLGEYTLTRSGAAGSATGVFSSRGWFVDALAIWPFERFSLFAKAGGVRSSSEQRISTTGAVTFVGDPNPKGTAFGYNLGAGASYALTERWSARLDYDVYKVGTASTNDFHVYVLSLGLGYRF